MATVMFSKLKKQGYDRSTIKVEMVKPDEMECLNDPHPAAGRPRQRGYRFLAPHPLRDCYVLREMAKNGKQLLLTLLLTMVVLFAYSVWGNQMVIDQAGYNGPEGHPFYTGTCSTLGQCLFARFISPQCLFFRF